MARITINGLGIEYELLGTQGAPAVALTPGGRFSKDTPGLRELGEALVAGGRRVLIWDRPNCGASDFTLEGDSESGVNGRTLAAMIREFDLGPTVVAGGSAGARVSMIAAAVAPDVVSHLILWWISGGPIGLMGLVGYYYGDAANRIGMGGMEAVANAPAWAELMQKNPRAREKILSQDPAQFIAAMQRWAKGFRPPDDSPVPGMAPASFAELKMPVLILRSGKSDVPHTRETSEWVHRLIPQSKLIEPPWPDDEWNNRCRDAATGAAPGLFVNWPKLAPVILDFVNHN
jgi:pimeloyl-ACP methyl ester carboxylesterase